jgi:Ca2+:H+ antiporter
MIQSATLGHLDRGQRATMIIAAAVMGAAAIVKVAGAGATTQFVVAGLALASLAAVIGQAIEQVGHRLGPGATGLLQSTLGNLPELFVGLFALRDGLTAVVQASLVGSVIGNALLVLGCAFIAGGLRHGTQKFDPEQPRLTASLLLLVVAALLVPTLASSIHSPAAAHAGSLSNACAVVLLLVYACSVPFYLRGRTKAQPGNDEGNPGPREGVPGPGTDASPLVERPRAAEQSWPLQLAVTVLAVASLLAALAADWFVSPLQEAASSLGLSEAFTGLVVVAIASNAVENVVGIRFALQGKPEYAISTSLSSPLQVALLLTPVLVLLSHVVGPDKLTLVFPPLLVAALGLSTIVVTVVIYDGEYSWLEGTALIGLYSMIAISFWWG